jgi:hypothetical protein
MTTETIDTTESGLPLAATPLFAILEVVRNANSAIEPGTKMFGVTEKGVIVMGIMMPSGKLLCAGGVEEDCPWNCEAESALTAIGSLRVAAETAIGAMTAAQTALWHYNCADYLTTEQQRPAEDALRSLANAIGEARADNATSPQDQTL